VAFVQAARPGRRLTLNELDHQLTISHVGAGVAAVLTYAGVGLVAARHQTLEPTHVSVWIRRLDETGNQLPRPVNVPR
jgi:hypothetical protein